MIYEEIKLSLKKKMKETHDHRQDVTINTGLQPVQTYQAICHAGQPYSSFGFFPGCYS
jgi:hypothetical protein